MLDRSQWTVTASSNSVGDGTGNAAGDAAMNAIDGDLDTRWTTGHGMKNGDWFQINLGSPASFNQIVLDNSVNSSFDYITKYQVYVSNDGVNWGSAIANGSGGIGRIAITLPTQTAQYIRIVSTATSGFWWSIGEINVYGPSNGTDSGSIASSDSGIKRPSVAELDQPGRGAGYRGYRSIQWNRKQPELPDIHR